MIYRGETHEHRSFFAGTEPLRLAQITDVGACGELTVDACAASMNHPFRDTLTVKALQFLQQLNVLQQHRTSQSSSL